MNEERFLEERGFEKAEDFWFNERIHSAVFHCGNTCVILDYEICLKDQDYILDYSKYCEMQNSLMQSYERLFRFYINDDQDNTEYIEHWLTEDPGSIEVEDTGGSFDKAHIDNTPLEKAFEDLFADTYGQEKITCLKKEYSISMSEGRNAFVDYVLETEDNTFAIEENGVRYHHPQIIGKERYIRQLEKQNTLCLLGFKTYRFSFENLQFKDQAVDRIKAFFGNADRFLQFGNLSGTRSFTLYEHQVDILKNLREDRENGINTALVVCPTGSGKSQIAIEDINDLYKAGKLKNVLVMAPTKAIRSDWEKRLEPLNKNIPITIDLYNRTFLRRNEVSQDYYDYILFDEAQHAQAANCRKTLSYFTPKYLIGLTATPERLDKKKLEEIFGNYETQLTLQEAIEKRIIANIRCFRLISNIDLSNVRYNGKDYNYADLERSLIVNSRNELIVDTLKKYFWPKEGFYKQGIIFCVNINHAKTLEKLMKEAGFTAAAVYGNNQDNERIFEDYRNRKIQFLMSCQMISEGWDSPQTEVVVMARPTLSKVLYMQQMGRGVRNFPGKECLYVIDVVDEYEGRLQPWSFNALMDISVYSPFAGVINNNHDYLSILGLHEEEITMEEINIFTFEKMYQDYLSAEQSARELFVGTSTLMKWYRDDPTIAGLTLPVGAKMMPYFSTEDIDRIREQKKLGVHNEETILQDFLDFIDENTLTFSFKLIFMRAMLTLADQNGEVRVDDLVGKYKEFYLNRLNRGLPVDRSNCVYTREFLEDETKLKKNILSNPFEKFERKRFVYYSKDLALLAFNPNLWNQLTEEAKKEVYEKEGRFLEEYYAKLGGL